MSNSTTGSIWRKWDLHVHTPASYEWGGKRLEHMDVEERTVAFRNIVEAVNASDVAVFGVMDYWTFDGYLALRRAIEAGTPCTKTLLPGIELRIECAADFRLNIHAIFAESTTDQQLRDFLATLVINLGGGKELRLSRDALVEQARLFPDSLLKRHGLEPEAKESAEAMYALGCKTAKIDRGSFWTAVKALGREKVLIVQPWGTYHGLSDVDWEKHPHDVYQFMQSADLFETRKSDEIDLFMARQTPKNELYLANFVQALGGRPKMVVAGSDAHAISKYGAFPGGRATWIKADPTFRGLLLATREPTTRTFVGEEPPKLRHVRQNPTRYVEALTIEKRPDSTLDEKWFACNLTVNPGLVAIIGNKGSGKSALLDILALLGNAHQSEMAFLTDNRFCQAKANKADHFVGEIRWCDGSPTRWPLSTSRDPGKPERVRYLPQSYIERLCAEPDETGGVFQSELEKVIFSHVPELDRGGFRTLQELLKSRAAGIDASVDAVRRRVKVVNAEIATTEANVAPERERALESELALKKVELDAHDGTKPMVVEEPAATSAEQAKALAAITAEQRTLDDVTNRIHTVERLIADARKRVQTVERLEKQTSAIESEVATMRARLLADLAAVGLEPDAILSLTVNRKPLLDLRSKAESEIATETVQLAALTEQSDRLTAQIQTLKKELDAPQAAYERYLTEVAAWQKRRDALIGTAEIAGSVAYLTDELRKLREVYPVELEQKRSERTKIASEVFAQLVQLRDAYRDAYGPVHAFVDEHPLAKEQLGLHFAATIMPHELLDRFFNFIHRGRRGSSYGEEEGRETLARLIQRSTFDDWKSVQAFLDSIVDRVTTDRRAAEPTPLALEAQLRRGVSSTHFYDFLFALEWLTPRYTLTLRGKELRSLSPGERGALLLVFYMLLDREDVPLLVDQPEHNLDNESIFNLLVPCIKEVRERRQVFIVTHNPNLAIVCDAEQIICASIDKNDGNRVEYMSGAIESPPRNARAVEVLEGTWPAFSNRRDKYFPT